MKQPDGFRQVDEKTLSLVEAVILRRRAVRHFLPDPIPEELLNRLLNAARWAPSGYNLQPTHYIAIGDKKIKKALYSACLNQRQILEAPMVIVFAGNRLVFENQFEDMVAEEKLRGSINENYEKFLRRYVGLAFEQGPWGLGWMMKMLLKPFLRIIKPTPDIPAVHKRYWITKQVMLSAMNFMLAATAAGLATVPMEGFDETRVRRVLHIPRSVIIPVVIPIGFTTDQNLKKTRLPLKKLLHQNRW